MTPQGHMTQKMQIDIILETVRDRAKWSEFSNPVGLLLKKLQLLKILSLGSHHSSRSDDLRNVNCCYLGNRKK